MDSMGNAHGRTVTIYDVAERAGVAPSTVSRALARPGRVSAATAAKVRASATELGYQRSSAAPHVTRVPSRLLAILVPDIGNPAFVEMLSGAETAAEEAGYTLILTDSREISARKRRIEQLLLSIDGLLLTSPRLSDSRIRMLAKQRPVVLLNRTVPGLPSILTDAPRGARRAVEHLAGLGHQEITYLAGPAESWTDGVRWRSLQDACVSLSIRSRRIGPLEPTTQGGMRAFSGWSAHPTSAVIAFNDLMAIGFIHRLRTLEIDVPGDVSVVGFDNTSVGALTRPALTSVATPLRSQGVIATRNLLAIIAGAQPTYEPVLLPFKLVPRDSTARACGTL